MWISILNYNIGQIEVADVTEDFAENKTSFIHIIAYHNGISITFCVLPS